VRVDAALEAGQLVGTHYDLMLEDHRARVDEEAARQPRQALDETAVVGLTSTSAFFGRWSTRRVP
jgi:acetyl/propionyl-CoA carboxylase alpha subunit